jgi:hypothetical protein
MVAIFQEAVTRMLAILRGSGFVQLPGSKKRNHAGQIAIVCVGVGVPLSVLAPA